MERLDVSFAGFVSSPKDTDQAPSSVPSANPRCHRCGSHNIAGSRTVVQRELRREPRRRASGVSTRVPERDKLLPEYVLGSDHDQYRRRVGRDRRKPIKPRQPRSEPYLAVGEITLLIGKGAGLARGKRSGH